MNEELLSYIWKHQLFSKENLCSCDAEALRVYHPGTLNTNSGPDFFNARIQIGDLRFAGNIELHTKSSDYLKHKHQHDPVYKSIVLHVVFEKDIELGLDCPELELKPFIDERLLSRFDYLRQGQGDIACSGLFNPQHELWPFWLERMYIERLEDKGNYLEEVLKDNAFHWEKSFYQILFRAFGFTVNALPFEILGRNIEPSLLHKYGGNLRKIEALLFGLSGFLNTKAEDGYQHGLKEEFLLQKRINSLEIIEANMWKFHRLRPSNFPCIRIAQLADVLSRNKNLLDTIIHANSLKELKSLFEVKASEYWENHSYFGQASKNSSTNLGNDSIDRILLNAVFPFIAHYARRNHLQELQERFLEMAYQIKAEENSINKKWKDLNLKINHAVEGQALIHLYKNYCIKRRCMDCQMSYAFLNKPEEQVEHKSLIEEN